MSTPSSGASRGATASGGAASGGAASGGAAAASGSAEQRVLAAIDAREVLELAQRLVHVPGENPPGEEAATAAELLRAAETLGLAGSSHEVAPGRPNATVTLAGGDGPGLLLLGHTDVVPVGDGWSVDPFGATIADGRLYGRGSADTKGGLAACLLAMAAVRRAGVVLTGPVYLAALADEEQEGIGVRDWIARPHPELLGCVVAEPTDLQTIIAARGASYLSVTVTGVAAHSGRPTDGRNAINGAAAIIADLERWHDELAAAAHPLAGPPTSNVGVVSGGTGASIVPAECHLKIDRRLLPGEDAAAVVAGVRERIAGLGLDRRGLEWTLDSPMAMPGFETPPDAPVVRVVAASVTDAGGPDLPLAGWTAACDGGFVAREWGVPVVVLGPGSVVGQAHRADESVPIEELVIAARAYALTIVRLLGAE